MKKLSLDLDTLAVESFDTEPARRAARGTVRGFDSLGSRERDASEYPCNTEWGCQVTEESCVEQTWDTCYGNTCFGVSCGPAGSCSVGCYVG